MLYLARIKGFGGHRRVYKIGVSKHPEKRMDELTRYTGFKHELVRSWETSDDRRVEAMVHLAADEFRLVREWFAFPGYSESAVIMAIECRIQDVDGADELPGEKHGHTCKRERAHQPASDS